MTNLITIHNVETGEIETRPMSAEELAQWEADKAENKVRAQVEADKISAKAALLEKLGINEDEARLLLG